MSGQPRPSQRIRAARANRRPSGLAATLLAFGIMFALAYVFIVRTPPPVQVPQIDAVRGSYTWQANTVQGADAATGAGTFSAVAGGDASGRFHEQASSGRAPVVESAYDAGTRTETVAVTAPAPRATRSATTVGAWPPAWRLATRSPLEYQGLAAVVRSAVDDGDRSIGVKPLDQGGRKVWRAAFTVDGEPVELVVDQLTGLVTWVAERGTTFSAAMAWDAPAAVAAAAVPTAAGGVAVTRVDDTYAYEPSLAAAGRAAGFTPLVSDLAPDGYAPAAIATADAAGAPGSWLAEDPVAPLPGPVAGQRQIAVLYLRGLSWFTVRQIGPRSARTIAASLRDTLASAAGEKLSFEQVTLQYGEFAGRPASTWYERSGPALLVGDDRHVVYVTGALTRRELLSLAEGLKPLRGAGAGASPGSGAGPGQSSAYGSNSSFSTPHSGHTQSSGRSSKDVPGSMPLSGSPTSGS